MSTCAFQASGRRACERQLRVQHQNVYHQLPKVLPFKTTASPDNVCFLEWLIMATTMMTSTLATTTLTLRHSRSSLPKPSIRRSSRGVHR